VGTSPGGDIVKTDEKEKLAHVKLGDAPVTVPAGTTTVAVLKRELGIDPADVLYLVHGSKRTLLADHESIDVESGMHFEAISGGGVS
jgi:hypothetical protein